VSVTFFDAEVYGPTALSYIYFAIINQMPGNYPKGNLLYLFINQHSSPQYIPYGLVLRQGYILEYSAVN